VSLDYDAIVIGGGHNSLTAAAYLAKAGMRVAVFEQRESLGGAASTEELIPGFHFNTGWGEAKMLLPEVVAELGLARHGLEWLEAPVRAFAPLADGRAITIWEPAERTAAELATFSPTDAAAYPKFAAQNTQFSTLLAEMARLSPPSLQYRPLRLLAAWARLAIQARRMGGGRMMEFLRVLPMGAARYLNEWFEEETLKGMLAAHSITALQQGPRAAGTAFMLLFQNMGASNRVPRGGVGAVSAALAKAAEAHGAELRTRSEVAGILVEGNRAVGVRFASGEELRAGMVLSGAEPRRTFLELVGGPQLEPRLVRGLRALKLKGSTATVHLALSGLPEFPAAGGDSERLAGEIVVCPSLDYAEQAYDDAKNGRISKRPVLIARMPSLMDASLAPAGQHTLSITVRYAPYHLRESTWDKQRERLGDLAAATLKVHAPGLEKLVVDRRVITPLDYERDYGLTEGSLTQGQMGLDQLVLMRPVPGFAGYRSPIDGLYLCGAGAHPGGGVTGAPGRNAARQVLQER